MIGPVTARAMMTEVKYSFLALLIFAAGCSQQPETPAAAPSPAPAAATDNTALDLYDISLNTDNITKGQQIRFCFKAKNAVMVTGFPGKFANNGALEGDCLVHTPDVDTLYRIEVTGSDGSKRTQRAYVRVRQ